ncbi:MAG: TonB-dependent receptor plug domain-containing protein, partial [Opitutaceae bacterium]
MRDTPVAYSVITREFIDALGLVDLFEASEWATGNTVRVTSGENDFFANTGEYNSRGFTAASGAGSTGGGGRQRNFFPALSLGDSYALERYDFGRGPNSILFGNGSLAGVSSSTTKRALTDRGFQTVRASFGSWQKFRSELDVNQPLLDQKAAVRLSLLWQDGDDWRDRDFEKRKAAFLTTTLKPFKNTEIRLEGEYFKIWRQSGNHRISESFAGWDGVTTYNSVQPLATLPANANALGVGRRGNYYIFDPHGPANAIMNYINEPTTLGGGATATTPIAGFTQVGGSFNSSGAPILRYTQGMPGGRFDTAIA